MSKNNSWLIWLVAIVAVVALIVAVVALGKISATGEAINFRANKFIVANSCDADSVCEVKGNISSENLLKLSSNAGIVKVESDLILTKLGQTNGVYFTTTNQGKLTIIPESGYADLLATLTLSGNNYPGKVVLSSSQLGEFNIIPSSGITKIEGSLSVTNLTGNGNAYICVNSSGKLYRSLIPCI